MRSLDCKLVSAGASTWEGETPVVVAFANNVQWSYYPGLVLLCTKTPVAYATVWGYVDPSGPKPKMAIPFLH